MEYAQFCSINDLDNASCCQVGEWRVEYVAFSHPGKTKKCPLVLLGGAFQTFRTFSQGVETIQHDRPIILVDLPSQGSNQQLASEMTLDGLADVLAGFLDKLKIKRINLFGISYGSLIAAVFATRHPKKVERLIVNGITTMGRPAVISDLKYAMQLLYSGDVQGFANMVVMHLVNYWHLRNTRLGSTATKVILRQMLRLTDNEKTRFYQNTNRLFAVDSIEVAPTCPVLVMVGEHDHFTMPYENAVFADACVNSQLALLRDTGHLNVFERPKVVSATVLAYLNDKPIKSADVTMIDDSNKALVQDRRLLPRLQPVYPQGFVISKELNIRIPVYLDSINFQGFNALIRASEVTQLSSQTLHLYLPALNETLPFITLSWSDRQLRGHILHYDLDRAERLYKFLNNNRLFISGNELLEESLPKVVNALQIA